MSMIDISAILRIFQQNFIFSHIINKKKELQPGNSFWFILLVLDKSLGINSVCSSNGDEIDSGRKVFYIKLM